MGEGVLQYATYEMERMFVVKPNLLKNKKEILRCFEKIISRNIENIFKECGIDPESETPIEEQEPKPLPDRKELDDIVFDAIDLTEEERKDVYRAVCRLVWNRISKAKSVKKR